MIHIEERNYIVYAHINKYNGKIYIGCTCRGIKNRGGINGINYRNCTTFYKAIQDYGWDGFEHIILIDNLTKDEAELFEGELIQKYRSTNPKFGYNSSPGKNKNLSENDYNRSKKDYSNYKLVSNVFSIKVNYDTVEKFYKSCKKRGLEMNNVLEIFMEKFSDEKIDIGIFDKSVEVK